MRRSHAERIDRAVALLREIQENDQKVLAQFPKLEITRYYMARAEGLEDAIRLLRSESEEAL